MLLYYDNNYLLDILPELSFKIELWDALALTLLLPAELDIRRAFTLSCCFILVISASKFLTVVFRFLSTSRESLILTFQSVTLTELSLRRTFCSATVALLDACSRNCCSTFWHSSWRCRIILSFSDFVNAILYVTYMWMDVERPAQRV